MNAAQSLFGISQLEAAKKVETSTGYFDNSYIIELSSGELVTIKELCDFWIDGHKKLDKAKEIIDDIERITKEKKKTNKETTKCNTTGEDTSTQNQSTGKKSRKSTKKTTTTQK